jgi:hypothetical protein
MRSDFLKQHIQSQADFVEFGYGQLEPNHLSAQRTGQIYAQLPANKNIKVLEQGQFVKYDYAAENGGEVNFTGAGEWMLVYNEVKLYRDEQVECEFALIADNFNARLYSPLDWAQPQNYDKQSRYYNGVDADGNDSITLGENTYKFDDVTAGPDYYEMNYTEDPFHFISDPKARKMPADTSSMIPRVYKTNVGDIITTNTIAETELVLGDILSPRAADGLLSKSGDESMKWQVVRVYTMPDHQKGVKLMRIA